jgi:tetratricopeptide (TPR) repeat protein
MNAVFVRLVQAREVLTDRKRRTEYESNLRPSRPRTGASPAVSAADQPSSSTSGARQAAPAHKGPEEVQALVEDALANARKLLAKGEPWDAIQALESALPLVEAKSPLKHRVQLQLARAIMKNPKWLKRAEELAKEVVDEAPKNVEGYLVLGTIYQSGGLKTRARQALQRVLEIDPRHVEARARLDALDGRR